MHFLLTLTSIGAAVIILLISIFLQIKVVIGVFKSLYKFFSKIFENPRCSLCNKEMIDYGCATGGLAPEPLYICVNEKCERCEL